MASSAAKSSEENPVLIVQSGKLNGTRWPIDREEFLIGRGPECSLVIPDRQVSRVHARLRRGESGYSIEDLGSKNGTHLNGAPVESATLLQDGDVIQVALAAKITFIASESTVPLTWLESGEEAAGQVRMDPEAHRVWVEGKELNPPLSPPQYRMLDLLYRNPGRVVSRQELVEFVWEGSEGEGVSEQAVDALARRLRERLGEADRVHDFIVTVRGHGFRLNTAL